MKNGGVRERRKNAITKKATSKLTSKLTSRHQERQARKLSKRARDDKKSSK